MAAAPSPLEVTLRQGVRAVFGEWTALQLAVEQEWGGHQTRAKALALLQRVEDGMCASAQVRRVRGEHLLCRIPPP